MSLAGLLREGREHLAQRNLEEAPLEAEVLLMHLRDVSRAYLYTHRDEPVAEDEAAAYRSLLERRARREPLAYITGQREFYGLDFYVDRRVLVPRPETELLVKHCLALVRPAGDSAPVIADIGTGSGAIAIALARNLPDASFYASDVSSAALEVAARNCRHHGVQDRVTLLQGNLLGPLPEPVDIVVANLPYVPTTLLWTLEPEVVEYEPRTALDGGPDGLDLIRDLLAQAPPRLRAGARILLEIGYDQAPGVIAAAALAMPGSRTCILQDLAGLDRVAVVELAA